MGTGAAENAYPHVSVDRCAAVQDGGEIRFQGRALRETPDISAPELRRANALLSTRCFEQADAAVEAYAMARPEDYQVAFLHVRAAWIYGQRDRGEAIANATLRQHPDFSSIKVLLASMRIDDGDFKAAKKWLDEVEAAHPNDLWAYIDRLRIDAMLIPSPAVAATLREIVGDAQFPPSARQQAAKTARNMRNVSDKESDSLFAAQMDAGGDDCVLAREAETLIELRKEPEAGARILEKYIDKSDFCLATPEVRTLLAEAYLLSAAKVAPVPTRKTERFVQQALAVTRGDLTPVAQRVAPRPQLASLIPYLGEHVDPLQIDAAGRNVLCNAVISLNATVVQWQLEKGAPAAAPCEGQSLVMRVLLRAQRDQVAERQQVLRLLLDHGTPVEGIEYCSSPDSGDCSQVLLPILDEQAARGPKLRT